MAQVSDAMLTSARNLGRRAGAASRDTGIPERPKFDKDLMPELYDAWSEGYVAGAYRK